MTTRPVDVSFARRTLLLLFVLFVTFLGVSAALHAHASALRFAALPGYLEQAANGPDTAPASPALIIGFVGGLISHDNPVHSEVQLAARLRKEYPSGVRIETFESYRGDAALRLVLKVLDANHNGKLTPDEKQNARIVIYGHSWGGSAAIALARSLQQQDIPVLLTVQVDSIAKLRQDDRLIPANVAAAANFYQPHGLLRGVPAIRAADPDRTRIIGNFQFDYESKPYVCDAYPWYDRIFVKAHTQIECDPKVWEQIDALIHEKLRP